MGDRDVTFDIFARDRASRALNNVGDSMDRAADKADKADNAFAKFGKRLIDVARQAAGVGASVATSAAPMAAGIVAVGKALSATGKAVSSLAPLASFLPSIAASAILVKLTMLAIGPAIAESLTPISTAFEAASIAAGQLASRGLPALATEFSRINMPVIQSAMEGIADTTNQMIVDFGRWTNSAAGASVIKMLAQETQAAFADLGPRISQAAIALGNLTGRAGGAAIENLGQAVGRVVDAFTRWANNTSADDITASVEKVAAIGKKLKDAYTFLRDVGGWMAENQAEVLAFSDALAAVGIALGAITANPVAVVVGGLVLLVNHWDALKASFSDADSWWRRIWSAISNDPSIKQLLQAVKDLATAIKGDFKAAWDMISPMLEKFGQAAQAAWEKIGPLVVKFFTDPNVIAGIRALALGMAALALMFVGSAAQIVLVIGAISAALAAILAWFVGQFVTGFLRDLGLLISKFGEWLVSMGKMTSAIPGLQSVGQAMIRAGQDAQQAGTKVKSLATEIGQLKSKTIVVTTEFKQSYTAIYNSQVPAAARSRGGPIPGAPSEVDTVPTMLAQGEYVVRSRQAAKYRPILEAINSGRGGDAVASVAPASTSTGGGNVIVTNYISAGAVGSESFLARTVSTATERSIRFGTGSRTLAGVAA